MRKAAVQGLRYLARVCRDEPGSSGANHGYTYLGHCGDRARGRRMLQSHRRALKLKDADSKAALERLRAAVVDEPDALAAEVRLAHSAMLAADQTRETWARAVNHLLDGFARNAQQVEFDGLAVDPRSGLPVAIAR